MTRVHTILRSPRGRAALLAVLLLSALAIGATLTFEAWRASRDHRRAVNRALAGYVDFAATSYRQALLSRLYVASTAVFRPLGPALMPHRDGSPPAIEVLAVAAEEAIRCKCGPAMAPRYLFRLDVATGALDVHGDTAGARSAVSRVLPALAPLRERDAWDYLAVYDSLAPVPQLVYATAWRGADRSVRAVYGFAVDLEAVRRSFLVPVFATTSLLPVPRATRLSNDSLLSLAVADGAGRTLVRVTDRAYTDTYATGIPAGAMMGFLQLRFALNAARAPEVLVGGLPPPRGPLLLGLLVLVAAVIAALCVVAWRAAELARLRTDFVAAVSHELRTPLAQILLFGDSLRLGRISARADVTDAGDVIVGESRRLMQLVENVLLFGRATRGAVRVSPEPTALAPLMRDVVDAFGPQAQAVEARVCVVGDDDVAVPADPNAMRQVLLNLLDNATKYGPPGQTIEVGVAIAGAHARVWVEDEGPGIPEAERERVWEPFVRLDRDLEANVAGSGIGLSVVREIVRLHGGRCRVESTRGRSARVVVELPGARRGDVMSACAS